MLKGVVHFTRANAIALLALFIALSGTTYAATELPKNSVGTKQLKKNAVTAGKIKSRAVTNVKIASRAVTGAKVKDGSLTGVDIVESSLGKVPAAALADSATSATDATNATKLGGVAAANYQRPGATLQPGQTEHGIYSGGGGPSAYISIAIPFDPQLSADLDADHTIYVTAMSAAHCPGIGRADPGYFCLYETAKGNTTFVSIGNPVAALQEASKEGANVFYITGPTDTNAYAYGEWAVTAP